MLYALLLLGLLPAAFLVDDKVNDETDDTPDSDEGTGDILDETVAPDSAPVSLTVPEGTEEVSVTGFRPGVDSLTIHLDSAQAAFSTGSDEGCTTLRIDGEEDECLVSFKGLEHVPVGDIRICVTDPATGDTLVYGLGEMGVGPNDPGNGDTLTGGGDNTGVDPNDPGDGDTLTGGDDPGVDPNDPAGEDSLAGGTEAGLDPVDPALADTLAPVGPDDGAPLEPNDPSEGDVLLWDDATGADPNDAAAGDGLAALPDEDSLFIAYRYEAAEAAAVIIDDFSPGSDILAISADITSPDEGAEVDVRPTEDGEDAEVWIGGTLCVILKGAPHASADDLHIALQAA